MRLCSSQTFRRMTACVKFVRDERTFTHRVGPDLDVERQEVMVDLQFTGRVAQHALVGRPQVPAQMETRRRTA